MTRHVFVGVTQEEDCKICMVPHVQNVQSQHLRPTVGRLLGKRMGGLVGLQTQMGKGREICKVIPS